MTTLCQGWGVPSAYCDDEAGGPPIGYDPALRGAYRDLCGALNSYPEIERAIRRMVAAGDTDALRNWDLGDIYEIGWQTSGHDTEDADDYRDEVADAIEALASLIDRRIAYIASLVGDEDTARRVWGELYEYEWNRVYDRDIRRAAKELA